MGPTPTILLAVHGDVPQARALHEQLEREGLLVVVGRTLGDVRARLRGADAAVAFHAPGPWTPLDVLEPEARRIPVAVVALEPEIEEALAALRAGFIHYATPNAPAAELVSRLRDALARRRPTRPDGPPSIEPPPIVGRSRALAEIQALLRRVATSAASTVLITGESGTGKDVLARAIHAHSSRAAGPFMNITCSAIPETLLESELFGHERGAFTDARERKLGLLEQATGGTVFLDEIGEMSLLLQAKLLRVLEERAFRRVGGRDEIRPDVRIVAATNRDLRARVREGHFRADLYFRLAVVELSLPSLRERPEDVEPLARHFIERFGVELRSPVRRLSPEAVRLLQRYPWPGNVRELRNTIERAVLLCDGPELDTEHLHLDLARASRALEPGFRLPDGGLVLRDLERDLLQQALEHARGNQTEAARLLGMSRDQVRYRVEKHGLIAGWRRADHGSAEEPIIDTLLAAEPTDTLAPLPHQEQAPKAA
ncbi:MAG: sigma-54-dependent Fis family transcriptional regulator [Planctomycetes bacterium]|nr:sigma-54-dependent Fis family transcriptional regulator [Planctomycetota bacterium]